jgi:hypothetical protein
MTFVRDPLAVRFDPQARLVVTLAIQQHGKHAANRRVVPYIRVRVPNPAQLALVRENGKARLSQAERAFTRALYYDDRIANANKRFHPDGVWSLKLTWDDPPLIPGRQRYVRVEVFRDFEGARYARTRIPSSEKFTENYDLQGTRRIG